MKKFLLFGFSLALGLAAYAQNPYAYDLNAQGLTEGKVAEGATEVVLSYTLNAPATAATVKIYNGEVVELTVEGETTAGVHEVSIPVSSLTADVTYTWGVDVEGAPVNGPVVFDKVIKVYSPAGLVVNNNPLSETFGRIYLSESYVEAASLADEKYISSPGVNNGNGVGIYIYDPQLNPVANARGSYGFNAGIGNTEWRPHHLAISDDGERVFIGNRRVVGCPVYELNVNNPDQITPLFDGTANTETGAVTNGDVTVCKGACFAIAAKGSGDDLKLAVMSYPAGTIASPANVSLDEYNLGSAATWNQAPSRNLPGITGKYAISTANSTILYDRNGGMWYAQYRYTGDTSYPSIVHMGANGESDKIWTDEMRIFRGGMAYINDKQMIMDILDGTFGVYDLSTDAAGLPQLTQAYTFNTSAIVRGSLQYAADVAGNIYTCDNGRENFTGYQLPRENNNYETPARQEYAFLIPSTTGVQNMASKAVSSVKYVNINGQQSDQPFDGVNVVITNYTDGSQKVTKIVK